MGRDRSRFIAGPTISGVNMKAQGIPVRELLEASHEELLKPWLAEGLDAGINSAWVNQEDARKLLGALRQGIGYDGDPADFDARPWDALRGSLQSLSASRAAQGGSAGETSRFILSLKRPIFMGLQKRLSDNVPVLMDAILWASGLVDTMAQFTVTAYQRSREDMIQRQQRELLELSTPVIKLWDGVLAVPMIGTLDSGRSQLVMEALLQRIVETGSELAIIDITGVPTVDTLVAQHLIKTVAAIRLMGADCIISGIRPQIAQTIVHLGIDLQGVTTKASLADALAVAMKRSGYLVTRPAR
jgi:rsbT co-antagonist protein RsbR